MLELSTTQLVSIGENLAEAVVSNVVVRMNVATAAKHCGASNFVQISTENAVNPTNIMRNCVVHLDITGVMPEYTCSV